MIFECFYLGNESEIFATYTDERDAISWCGINEFAKYRKRK